jgi:hypothetical protein
VHDRPRLHAGYGKPQNTKTFDFLILSFCRVYVFPAAGNLKETENVIFSF